MKTLLLCLLPLLAAAQNPGNQGKKYNISGHVAGTAATLTLSGSSSAQTTTDAFGNYRFRSLRSGSYVVAPSQPGFTFSPSSSFQSLNNSNIFGVNFSGSVVQHSVFLRWGVSPSPNISGYNLWRGTSPGGPYTLQNLSLIAGTSITDSTVGSGQTDYYVVTAVDSGGAESDPSNEATATIP